MVGPFKRIPPTPDGITIHENRIQNTISVKWRRLLPVTFKMETRPNKKGTCQTQDNYRLKPEPTMKIHGQLVNVRKSKSCDMLGPAIR